MTPQTRAASERYVPQAGSARELLADSRPAGSIDASERFAQQHNLMVSRRNAAERTLVLTGALGDILSAFHADLHMFHHSSGTYRGRRGEIFIPARFEHVITDEGASGGTSAVAPLMASLIAL
jgi:hypothetical protein